MLFPKTLSADQKEGWGWWRMCVALLVFLHFIMACGLGGGGCFSDPFMCSLLYPNTCQKIDPSSQFLSIFNPTSLKIVPLFILCPKKKNLFNLLVYLRAVFLCPSALSLLSHWLWGLVRHKSKSPANSPSRWCLHLWSEVHISWEEGNSEFRVWTLGDR